MEVLFYFVWKRLNHSLLVKIAPNSDIASSLNYKCEFCLPGTPSRNFQVFILEQLIELFIEK